MYKILYKIMCPPVKMKLIVIALVVVGIVMVLNGYNLQNQKCPPPVIKYKYMPRTFSEGQDNPPQVSQIFRSMFDERDPGPV